MPFNPALPVNGSTIYAAELRGQFNGLKDLIDAAPGITAVVVDGVNTVPAGQPAGVSVSVSGGTMHLLFNIPQGADGATGGNGGDGAPGTQGPQGAPGEVSTAALAAALATTSANTNGVATLDTPFTNDPPTLADIEAVRAKINELITAMRR